MIALLGPWLLGTVLGWLLSLIAGGRPTWRVAMLAIAFTSAAGLLAWWLGGWMTALGVPAGASSGAIAHLALRDALQRQP